MYVYVHITNPVVCWGFWKCPGLTVLWFWTFQIPRTGGSLTLIFSNTQKPLPGFLKKFKKKQPDSGLYDFYTTDLCSFELSNVNLRVGMHWRNCPKSSLLHDFLPVNQESENFPLIKNVKFTCEIFILSKFFFFSSWKRFHGRPTLLKTQMPRFLSPYGGSWYPLR